MISDLAGSPSSPGTGTGIPGPLLATLKELSALPLIHDIKIHYCKPGHNEDVTFSAFVSKLFNGTYFMNQDGSNRVPFDLRTEIGLAHDVGRQTVPVLVNECIVRAFYSIRRFANEITSQEIPSVARFFCVTACCFYAIIKDNAGMTRRDACAQEEREDAP